MNPAMLGKVLAEPHGRTGPRPLFRSRTRLLTFAGTFAFFLLVQLTAVFVMHSAARRALAEVLTRETAGAAASGASALGMAMERGSDPDVLSSMVRRIRESKKLDDAFLAGREATVVAGAVLIHFTGWLQVDPVLSGLIAVMIGIWSYRLLRDSANVLLESTPRHIRLDELDRKLRAEFSEIKGLHDIHVWEITSGMHAMTAHITVEPHRTVEELERIRSEIERFVLDAFRIGHTAFQFESAGASTRHSEGSHP